jgi:hypothetical protein
MMPAKCRPVAARGNRVSTITWCLNGSAHDMTCSPGGACMTSYAWAPWTGELR